MIDKVKSMISIWKGRVLSFAGRVCLIKSIISALFYISSYRASKSVCMCVCVSVDK